VGSKNHGHGNKRRKKGTIGKKEEGVGVKAGAVYPEKKNISGDIKTGGIRGVRKGEGGERINECATSKENSMSK